MSTRSSIIQSMADLLWVHASGELMAPSGVTQAAKELVGLYEIANDMTIEQIFEIAGLQPDSLGMSLAEAALDGRSIRLGGTSLRRVTFEVSLDRYGDFVWTGDVPEVDNPGPRPRPEKMMFNVTWSDGAQHHEVLADNQAGNLSRQLRSRGISHTISVARETRKTPHVARGSRRT